MGVISLVNNHRVILGLSSQFILDSLLLLHKAIAALLVIPRMCRCHVSFWSNYTRRYFCFLKYGILSFLKVNGCKHSSTPLLVKVEKFLNIRLNTTTFFGKFLTYSIVFIKIKKTVDGKGYIKMKKKAQVH